jgi:hypothetical protein
MLDDAALTKCLQLARADPAQRQQIEEMLAERDALEVAEFAAYCVQARSL